MSVNPSWPSPPLSGIPSAGAEPPLSPAPQAPVRRAEEPEPAPTLEPAAPAAPAPAFEPAPLPTVPPQPAPPVAAPAPEPARSEPEEAPWNRLQPEPAAEQAPAAPTAFGVLIHLDDGEKIEVASHPDEAAARAEATALMRYLRDGRGDWPFVAGRFVRPERIVSVDLDER